MAQDQQQDLSKNKIYNAFEAFGNIVALNVIFLLFCIPVITIGASFTAMYTVSLKMVRKEEGAIWKSFFEAFKSNFKKSTILWILVMISMVVLFGEYLYIINFNGVIVSIYIVIFVMEIIALSLIIPFIFPLCARYENTVFNTIINALLLSVSNLGSWVKVFIAWVAPVAFTVMNPILFLYTWYLWLIAIFGLIAYGTSFTLRKLFDKIAKVQEENEEKKKEEGKKTENKKLSLQERLKKFDK